VLLVKLEPCTPVGYVHEPAGRQTPAEESACWRCGSPGTPDNPLEAGHVIARVHGGSDHRSNYRAECRGCNRSAGHLLSQEVDVRG
jgi:5-methylcytosine-specific restriction endonuclease McrA